MTVLRPLRADDLDALLEVQREGAIVGLGHIFPQESSPFPTARLRQRWEAELSSVEVDCFAIVGEGGFAGFAGFAATRGDELLHFGTALRTWGTGLADLAHSEVLAHFRTQGVASAQLWVFERNVRAVRFYRRRGWLGTGETRQSSFEPFPVLTRLRRDLSPPAGRGHELPGVGGAN